MKKYIGITIGPIFDTISDASSPAALWFASSMFSDITVRICEKLVSAEGFPDAIIYSPYFDRETNQRDGVGKYHDRIFFSTEQFDAEKMNRIIDNVKTETVAVLGAVAEGREAANKQFFKEYLQIHYMVAQESQIGDSNCILAMSPYLDALELMKTFPTSDVGNPIQYLFQKNAYIEQSVLFPTAEQNKGQFITLEKGRARFRRIDEVAFAGNEQEISYKKQKYFALVTADADNMGRFLTKLSNEEVQQFSKHCLDYAGKSAAKIGEYQGMTIYAGGDDLLFLAPVETAEGKTVFDLCQEIHEIFKNCMVEFSSKVEESSLPTISFGISIQYVKYPLYEAIEKSRSLLWQAKACEGKDAMVIGLQKHSGQSVVVQVGNECYEALRALLATMETTATEEEVHSIIYTLENMKTLICTLDKQVAQGNMDYNRYAHAWGNLFDNDGQASARKYIDGIGKMYYDMLQTGARINVSDTEDTLGALLGVLRIKKFLEEKGVENR